MAEQIHRSLTDEHVKTLLDLYQNRALCLADALQRLGCRRSQFYESLKRYRKDSNYSTSIPPAKMPSVSMNTAKSMAITT